MPDHSSAPSVAFVTGATGTIGPILVRRLVDQGYQVRVLARSQPSPGLLPESARVHQGDITECQVMQAAMTGVHVVFHLAAKLHVSNPIASLRAEYQRVNVRGTRCLVEAAREAGVLRLVSFSTISVYGPSQPGQVLDECSPLRPDSWYAETKAEGEQAVLGGIRSVVLRLAAVYGPRMRGNYPRLLDAIRKRRFVMIGDGCNRRTLVHTNDVCAAALLAASHPDAEGRVYNITDGRVHTMQDIIRAICAALGQHPPRLHLPVGPVRLAAGLLEDGFHVLGRRSPIGRSVVDKLTEDVTVSGERIQQELGFRPQYDLSTGWQEAVRGMSSG